MVNVLFFGRKQWSVYALEHLVEEGYTIIGVVGMKDYHHSSPKDMPIYRFARTHQFPVYDNDSVYEYIDIDQQTFDGKPIDIIVSYLYYARIKVQLLEIVRRAAINFYPAPLPDYRGLGGYNMAILEGKKEYGVSAHLMVEDFDAGDIISVSKFKLVHDETAFTLEGKSMEKMLELFKDIFSSRFETYMESVYENDKASGVYVSKESIEQLKFINQTDTDEVIERKVRAFWYPPFEGAKVQVGNHYYTIVNEEILKSVADFMR